jgi:hypothetical protein
MGDFRVTSKWLTRALDYRDEKGAGAASPEKILAAVANDERESE